MSVNNDPVSIENLKGAIDLAKEAIRALHLANGGAVVGLLTFYGNIAAQGKFARISVNGIALSLEFFAFGLVFGIATSMLAYLSQIMVATFDETPWELRFRFSAMTTAGISLCLFVAGVCEAGLSFRPTEISPARVASRAARAAPLGSRPLSSKPMIGSQANP
ncbi:MULTISPECIES: hypothetical protein [Sphingomonas]|jgi:hypothetical protein|uniref:hypothetical protein n=1 Tax=Sphingomonas TaxID=13687 RepID=UPI001AE39382